MMNLIKFNIKIFLLINDMTIISKETASIYSISTSFWYAAKLLRTFLKYSILLWNLLHAVFAKKEDFKNENALIIVLST